MRHYEAKYKRIVETSLEGEYHTTPGLLRWESGAPGSKFALAGM